MIIMLVGIILYIIGVILEAPLLYTAATAVSIGPIGAEIGNAPVIIYNFSPLCQRKQNKI
jgi:hypothetical protein